MNEISIKRYYVLRASLNRRSNPSIGDEITLESESK